MHKIESAKVLFRLSNAIVSIFFTNKIFLQTYSIMV